MVRTGETWVSYFGETSCGVWRSKDFLVAAFPDNGSTRLDIQRNDGKDGITWDQLQDIKNKCGFSDYDGIEFFPKEVDVLNTGNFRHLYLFREDLPFIRRG